MKHGVTERGVTETVVEVRDVNGRSGHAELTELTVTSSRGLTYRRPMSSAGSEATVTTTMTTTTTSGTAIESTRVRALVRAQALRRLREITEDLTRLDEWGRSEDSRWVRSDLRQIGEPETVERLVPLESTVEPRRAVSSSLVALGRVEDAHESPGREPFTREPDSALPTAGRSDEDAREVRG